MTGRTELAALVQRDGTIEVLPSAIADELLRLTVFALTARARSTGGVPTAGARRWLSALYGTAHRPLDSSPAETEDVDQVSADTALTVREVADRMGCSPQYVRQLLAAGKLAGRKSGGTWIIYTGRSVADSQAPQGDA